MWNVGLDMVGTTYDVSTRWVGEITLKIILGCLYLKKFNFTLGQAAVAPTFNPSPV